MDKLNGIIKGFNKVISKLDALVEGNEKESGQLGDEITEKKNKMVDLTRETVKAKSIRAKIEDLLS